MSELMSADDIFLKAEAAAVAATGPDEKALQIDYDALREKFRKALDDRKVALCHVNKFLPEGYEDQGRFNLVLLTAGKVVFDIVIGDSYFRYDVVSVGQLEKVQLIDPGTDQSVTFTDLGQVPFASQTTVSVDVAKVPGETNTSNNSASYQVIFSLPS